MSEANSRDASAAITGVLIWAIAVLAVGVGVELSAVLPAAVTLDVIVVLLGLGGVLVVLVARFVQFFGGYEPRIF
jgi:hypothetical protein